MDDTFDPAATANFPLVEANDWIVRWRAVGGGFFCRVVPEGIEVQLARHVPEDMVEDLMGPHAELLQSELLAAPRIKGAVMTLVSQQWQTSVLASEPPAGSA